jgi:hypothetical protein
VRELQQRPNGQSRYHFSISCLLFSGCLCPIRIIGSLARHKEYKQI